MQRAGRLEQGVCRKSSPIIAAYNTRGKNVSQKLDQRSAPKIIECQGQMVTFDLYFGLRLGQTP